MHSILGHIAALVAGLTLALPPGACSFLVLPKAGGGRAAHSCCMKVKAPAHQSPAQGCPAGGCCCERQAIAGADQASAPDLQAVSFATGIVASASPIAGIFHAPTDAALATGPPLNVLHC